MSKAEVAESVTRSIQRLKDQAQLIVDDIEVNKFQMTNKLDGAGTTCEEAQWVLSAIQPGDVKVLCAEKKRPSYSIAKIMDCVLLMFQRPLNSVELDTDKGCIKPSWNESVKVRNFYHLSYTVKMNHNNSSYSKLVQYFCYS